MSNLYDDTTNLFLGNSKINPLCEVDSTAAKKLRPSFEEELSKMILSASGWRKIFAASGDENDSTEKTGIVNKLLATTMADSYSEYIKLRNANKKPVIALGIDTRPTGTELADIMIRVFIANNIDVQYLFITAAPEIMAYSHKVDGFVYISASHNPIGHNGVKFGANDGGVIPGSEAAILADMFRSRCANPCAIENAVKTVSFCKDEQVDAVYKAVGKNKKNAVETYLDFTKQVVSGESDKAQQNTFFDIIKKNATSSPIAVVCDMNGSARTLSIDKTFLPNCGLGFYAINDKPREIVHAIIPEPENLVHCAAQMARLHKEGHKDVVLGYMPDCDGDRGNIVYWDEKKQSAEVLKAQEVFALSVMSELASLAYAQKSETSEIAVAVNDPTSMRIEDIADAFNAKTFRAEVGEANVVNLAREKRAQGYTVRILGEGSNGGNITHPAAVRDPLNTIFALIKLLAIRDTKKTGSGTSCTPAKKGLFHLWCSLSKQEQSYHDDFSISDIIATLPIYTTTGVSEPRAVLKIKTRDHGSLKASFQKVFIAQWEQKKNELSEKYGITDWEAICNNGTKETHNVTDFSISQKGGLKILFKDKDGQNIAFIWMRGSGTEPVFRVLCDVKGNKPEEETFLLSWETSMLLEADGN